MSIKAIKISFYCRTNEFLENILCGGFPSVPATFHRQSTLLNHPLVILSASTHAALFAIVPCDSFPMRKRANLPHSKFKDRPLCFMIVCVVCAVSLIAGAIIQNNDAWKKLYLQYETVIMSCWGVNWGVGTALCILINVSITNWLWVGIWFL